MRRLAALGALGTLTVLLAGCVSPAWDDHDYSLKAAATAEAAASSLEIVRLAVANEARLTTPYLKTVLTEAAEETGGLGTQFGGVQPPSDAADRVQAEVLDLTSRAEEQVSDLLVQVRRDGVEDPARAVRELEGLAAELRRFGEAHR